MTSGEAALDLAHPSAAPKPLARVYGEPFNELPQDLYIPPEALEVFLETFEGPFAPGAPCPHPIRKIAGPCRSSPREMSQCR
jgi:hypothetical protein